MSNLNIQSLVYIEIKAHWIWNSKVFNDVRVKMARTPLRSHPRLQSKEWRHSVKHSWPKADWVWVLLHRLRVCCSSLHCRFTAENQTQAKKPIKRAVSESGCSASLIRASTGRYQVVAVSSTPQVSHRICLCSTQKYFWSPLIRGLWIENKSHIVH